ncbi:MAG: DMT family transporter [Parvularculaceae bacterium]
MTMPWLYLAIAVVANIATNLMLKKTMAAIDAPFGAAFVKETLVSPWLWGALVAGGTLLGSYLLAIRTLDLSLSYAVVTSAALVGITVFAAIAFGEAMTAMKLSGTALIILGIALITHG